MENNGNLIQNPLKSFNYKRDSERSPLVVMESVIHVPVEKAFQAWADPQFLQQWWGGEHSTCTHAETEFRIGGSYLLCMTNRHDEIWSTGFYREIEPNLRIVMSDYRSNAYGDIIPPQELGGNSDDSGMSHITVDFEAQGNRLSVVTVSHQGLPAKMQKECVAGWKSALNRMKRFLEKN